MGLFGSSSSSTSLQVGETGNAFVDSGINGFRARFMKMCYAHKTSLANLSEADKIMLHEIISSRMRQKVTGSDITGYDRTRMREQAYRAYKAGNISQQDLKDFTKIIRDLRV